MDAKVGSNKRRRKEKRQEKRWMEELPWETVEIGENMMFDEPGLLVLEEIDGKTWEMMQKKRECADTDAESRKGNGAEDEVLIDGGKDVVEENGIDGAKQGDIESTSLARKKSKKAKKKEKKKKKSKGDDGAEESKDVCTDKAQKKPVMHSSEDGKSIKRAPVDVSGWAPFSIDDRLLKAFGELGFKHPTPIQERCLPLAMRDRKDIIGAAETGSGKTLSFGIPIVQRLVQSKCIGQGIAALILAPTRELALQVKDHIVSIAKYTSVKTIAIVGGMASQKQERQLRQLPDIVVATPGRLWELMLNGNSQLNALGNVQFLVLDEADRMIQQGHFKEMDAIVRLLVQRHKEAEHPPKLQTFLFSATLSVAEDDIVDGGKANKNKNKNKKKRDNNRKKGDGRTSLEVLLQKLPLGAKPSIVDLTRREKVVSTLEEGHISCMLEDKDVYLVYFLARFSGRTLVFCNSISGLRRLRAVLDHLKFPNVCALHAEMQQRQRLKNLERFTHSKEGVCIATDVAARGLDIPQVEHVVHYQMPRSAEVYVHRSGRTARACSEGASLALISPEDSKNYHKICKELGKVDGLPVFPVDVTYLPKVRDRVVLARKIDKLLNMDNKKKSKNSWFEKQAAAMDMDLDDDLLEDEGDEYEKKKQRMQIESMKAQLDRMLKDPLVPKRGSLKYLSGMPTGEIVAAMTTMKKSHKGAQLAQKRKAIEEMRQLKNKSQKS